MPNAEIIAYVPPRHTRACTHAPPQDSQHVSTHRGPCCSALRGRGAVDMGFPACTAQILPFYSDDARNKAINLTQHHRMEPNCSVTLPWHCCESHGTGLCCTGRAPGRRPRIHTEKKTTLPPGQGSAAKNSRRMPPGPGSSGVNAILESLGPKAIFWTPWEQKSSVVLRASPAPTASGFGHHLKQLLQGEALVLGGASPCLHLDPFVLPFPDPLSVSLLCSAPMQPPQPLRGSCLPQLAHAVRMAPPRSLVPPLLASEPCQEPHSAAKSPGLSQPSRTLLGWRWKRGCNKGVYYCC